MGLDFCLFEKKKNIPAKFCFEDDRLAYDEELAYGRKSWELVYELATKEDIELGYGIVKKEKWDNLMSKLEAFKPGFERAYEAYDHLNNCPEDYIDEEYIFTSEDRKVIAEYEYWYNKSFNDEPTLGYDFSIGYMKSFLDAKDRVNEILDDPDWEVLMSISY